MRELNQKLLIMKALKQLIVLCVLVSSFYSFSEEQKEFKILGSSEALETMSSQFKYKSSLYVVQKRWLPRKFLSEVSVAASPILKGINYLNTASLDATYRFYLSNHWSVHFKYSYFLNAINEEGREMYHLYSKNPLDLEHSQKQEYSLGFDWTPFYGKIAVLNKVIHFDIYMSLDGGYLELFRLDEKSIPTVFVSGGIVFWLSKRVNARLGLSGSYYKYNMNESSEDVISKYLSKAHVSVGFLF